MPVFQRGWRLQPRFFFVRRLSSRRTQKLRARITQPLTPLATRVSGWYEFLARHRYNLAEARWPLIEQDVEEILEKEIPVDWTAELLVSHLPIEDQDTKLGPRFYWKYGDDWYRSETTPGGSIPEKGSF